MKRMMLLLVLVVLTPVLDAQSEEPNYDEALVPQYTLPEILVTSSGEKVNDSEMWEKTSRPELLQLFRD